MEMTFQELNQRYLEGQLRGKATYDEFKGIHRQLFHNWLQHPTRPQLRDWHKSLHDTPGRANKALGYIRAMYNWAIANDLWNDENPTAGLKRHKMFSRERTMTTIEVSVLMNALPFFPLHFRTLLTVLLTTGCRLSEARLMQRKDVDIINGVWIKPHTKNGRPQRLPLPTQTREALALLPTNIESPYVFTKVYQQPIGESAVERAWRQARRQEFQLGEKYPALRMPDVRLHDFRRTVASRLVDQGEHDRVIKAILNHHQSDVTSIYARASFETQQKALQKHADNLYALNVEIGGTHAIFTHSVMPAAVFMRS